MPSRKRDLDSQWQLIRQFMHGRGGHKAHHSIWRPASHGQQFRMRRRRCVRPPEHSPGEFLDCPVISPSVKPSRMHTGHQRLAGGECPR